MFCFSFLRSIEVLEMQESEKIFSPNFVAKILFSIPIKLLGYHFCTLTFKFRKTKFSQ